MTTCLIFGGNGFIGSHLAEELVKQNFNVKIFDTFKNGTKNIESILNKIEIVKGDFFCELDVSNAMRDVDYIFHYISTTNPASSIKNPLFDIESNVMGSIKMFQIAGNTNIKKIFFPSSGGTVYGEPMHIPITENDPTNPTNPYAISKLTIEKFLEFFYRQFGMEYVIFRYSNPYGERQSPYGNQGVIPIFLNKIKNNERPTIYGNGESVRDYIYIDDAIDATLSVIKKGHKNTVYNIGSGEGTSLNELIAVMQEVTGKNIKPVYSQDSAAYISKIVLDIQKITVETEWQPRVDIRSGIEKTWQWIRSQN
jgi:UDP-glucose 4-epimerase